MELCHDYIQWLFPTDEKSRFNPDAPFLGEEVQRVFHNDGEIRGNFIRGLQHFYCFLGLCRIGGSDTSVPLHVTKLENFDARFLRCWRGPDNHNWRRITRVLRCLRLIGMADEQLALYAALEAIIAEHPGSLGEESIAFWRSEVAAVRKHTISNEFAQPLLQSPAMLQTICKSQFHSYDVNRRDVLEFDQILDISIDLQKSLGIDLDEGSQSLQQSKEHLLTSMQEIVGSGQQCLKPDDFPKWFSGVLKEFSEDAAGKSSRTDSGSEGFTNRAYASEVLSSPDMIAYEKTKT
jgi:hypothetical protein